jgi:hypothetical protein
MKTMVDRAMRTNMKEMIMVGRQQTSKMMRRTKTTTIKIKTLTSLKTRTKVNLPPQLLLPRLPSV